MLIIRKHNQIINSIIEDIGKNLRVNQMEVNHNVIKQGTGSKNMRAVWSSGTDCNKLEKVNKSYKLFTHEK